MKLSTIQIAIAEEVIKQNKRIGKTALTWGISKSTVVRYMDKYMEELAAKKAAETIENAYIVHIEIHVGNDTRHLHQIIYAPHKEEAEKVMANMKPDYRGNDDPSYQLQIKSGPFKLTENLWLLEEY